MEFLKLFRRRSFLSELVYAVLNIGLAIALLVVVRTTESVFPAFGLIILSKWRVLAVRPRYWFANLQANLVDFIVSISLVVFLYTINSTVAGAEGLFIQCILAILYILWLLLLKPQSKKGLVVAQAAVALFVGVSALYTVSYAWPVSLVVVCMWLIGYTTARHVLVLYKEDHLIFLSLVWGFILAELGWLAYHWAIAYNLPFVNELKIPQISLIVLSIAFLIYKAYDSFAKHQKIRLGDVILPLLFTVSIVVVLVVFFNRVSTGII